MSKEELDFHLDMIMNEWKQEIMEEFGRDGDGYIDSVEDSIDEVREMLDDQG
jgi:hypothetical protein